MKCPVCGLEYPSDSKFCIRCGSVLKPKHDISNNSGNSTLMICFILAGIIAGWVMIAAGADMSGISSQAGNTIAEAFYQAMGKGFIGLGIFAAFLLIAIGIFLGRSRRT